MYNIHRAHKWYKTTALKRNSMQLINSLQYAHYLCSDTKAKYIQFNNDMTSDSSETDLNALKNALAIGKHVHFVD